MSEEAPGDGANELPVEPEIDLFLLADAAQEVGGKIYILGGGFGLHNAIAYPSVAHFFTVISVLVPLRLSDQELLFSLEYSSPDGSPFAAGRGSFRIQPKPEATDVPLRGTVILDTQLALPIPGRYMAEVRVGEQQRRAWFQALEAPDREVDLTDQMTTAPTTGGVEE